MADAVAPPDDLQSPPADTQTVFDGQPPSDLMTPPPDLQQPAPVQPASPSPPPRPISEGPVIGEPAEVAALRQKLTGDNGVKDRGALLPVGRDAKTGKLTWAVPEMARSLGRGLMDVVEEPYRAGNPMGSASQPQVLSDEANLGMMFASETPGAAKVPTLFGKVAPKGGPPPDLEMAVNPAEGVQPGPAGSIPRSEALKAAPQANAVPEPPLTGWNARRPGESAKTWKERTSKTNVTDIDPAGSVVSEAPNSGVEVNQVAPKALPTPRAHDAKITPATIAAEHDAEISSLDAQGTLAADPANKVAPTEVVGTSQAQGLSLPQKPWDEITPEDVGQIKGLLGRANNLRTQAFKAIPKKGDKTDATAAHKAAADAFFALSDQIKKRYGIDWQDIRKSTPTQIAQTIYDRNDPETVSAAQDIANYNHFQTFSPPEKAHTLFDEIRDLGGVRDDGGNIGQILQGYKNPKFKKGLINPQGLSPDALRGALQERGWFEHEDRFGPDVQETGFYPGDSLTDMHDLIEQEARGNPVLHPDDASHRDQWSAFEDQMNRAGVGAHDSFEESARKLADFRKLNSHNEPPHDLVGETEEIPGWDDEHKDLLFGPEGKGEVDDLRLRSFVDKPNGLHNALTHIEENSTDPQTVKLAKTIKASVGKGVALRTMTPAEIAWKEAPNRAGFYDPNTDAIALHPTHAGDVSYALLHEAVHAATAHAIFAGTPAGLELTRLFNDYKNLGDAAEHYGLESPHEFVAEALSNPKFQETLKGLTPDSKLSLWQRFKNAIKKAIGLPIKSAFDKMLDSILEAVPRAAEEGRAEFDSEAGLPQQNAKPPANIGQGGGEGYVPEGGGDSGPPFVGGTGGAQPKNVGGWLTKHEDELYRLMNNNKVDKIEALLSLWKLPDGHPMRDTAMQAKLFHHGEEEGKFTHEQKDHILTPEEQEMFDKFIQPLREMANEEYNIVAPKLSPEQRKYMRPKDNLAGYMHRIVKGKGSEYDPAEGPGEQGDPITGRGRSGRGLGRKTDSLYGRSPMYVAVGLDGSKVFIKGDKFQDDRVGRNGKPVDNDAKDGAIYKDNKTPGGNRVLRPATVEEIEQNTKLRYHKNALINTMDNLLKLRRVSRNLDYLNVLKADPIFVENSIQIEPGQRPPEGRRETTIPQLRGTYMNPRLANMFDDYYNIGMSNDALVNGLNAVNSAMVRMIFANPVTAFMGHGANVAVHTIVQRGAMNFDPRTYPKSIVNFGKATNEVLKMGPVYRELLRQGMAGQYAAQFARDFPATAMKMMQGEIEKDPKTWKEIAGIVGSSPKVMYDWLSDTSSKGLWMASDILLTSHVLDLMDQKNMPVLGAIREAEKGIPNYRIPTEAWEGPGGRFVSRLMGTPLATVFGRYHYGIVRAYAYTLRNMLAKEGQGLLPPPPARIEHQPRMEQPWAEGENAIPSPPPSLPGTGQNVQESKFQRRAIAAGQLIALFAVMQVMYPELDKAVQWLAGNKHASIRRAGAASVPTAIQAWATDAYKHAKTTNDFRDLHSVFNAILGLPPLMQGIMAAYLNTNPVSGKHIYNPKGGVGEVAQELGGFAATSAYLGQEGGEWTTGNKSWPQTVAGMLGISSPTAAQFAMQRHYATKDTQSDTSAFRKRKAARIRSFEKKMGGLGSWFKSTVNPTGGGN